MQFYGTNGVYRLRTLQDGSQEPEYETAIDLTIHTKCPGKWLLIDLETGQQYRGSEKPNMYGKWKRVSNE
jgi:hypothetical protein